LEQQKRFFYIAVLAKEAKLFMTLENSQQDIILSGTVWLDETYYPVISSQVDYREDGTKYQGLSHNQICIGVATDKRNAICFVEGFGKPSKEELRGVLQPYCSGSHTDTRQGNGTQKTRFRFKPCQSCLGTVHK